MSSTFPRALVSSQQTVVIRFVFYIHLFCFKAIPYLRDFQGGDAQADLKFRGRPGWLDHTKQEVAAVSLRGKKSNKKPESNIQGQRFNLVALRKPQQVRVSDGKTARDGHVLGLALVRRGRCLPPVPWQGFGFVCVWTRLRSGLILIHPGHKADFSVVYVL